MLRSRECGTGRALTLTSRCLRSACRRNITEPDCWLPRHHTAAIGYVPYRFLLAACGWTTRLFESPLVCGWEPSYANLISALAALESNLRALTVSHVDEALAEQRVITPSTTWSTARLTEQFKEPAGLIRSDGKRPDGLTLIPWSGGRCLTWDVTVTDTLAESFLPVTSPVQGGVADFAAERKELKYQQLANSYSTIS